MGQQSVVPSQAVVVPEPEPGVARGPDIELLGEVRLAVVLYGGVSLAIYMNGIAQELFHLVRATAPAVAGGETALLEADLTSSERAYRKLGQIAGDLAADPGPTSPIHIRFVVDVLSGTSAGGINGVYLAKALANGRSPNALTELWQTQGDIETLLNDEGSRTDRVGPEEEPQSLLNNRRMYCELLSAFRSMNPEDGAAPAPSPFVEELDLFVTTTDLLGLQLPLRLTNRVVEEARYRNVFHFRYSAPGAAVEHNDFLRANDPFLAFACRCTSAFPMAFRPMELTDIDDVVELFPEYRGMTSSTGAWQSFYADYVNPPPDGGRWVPFAKRPFADGGALDNKPFGHAIDELSQRRADVPIDRKLVFLEPDPTRPATPPARADTDARPDALRNLLDQSVLLPRQESIREDLRRLDDRNRIIRRVNSLLAEVDRQVLGPMEQEEVPEEISRAGEAALDRPLDEDVEDRGRSYSGYVSLRTESTIEDLALVIANAVAVAADSEYVVAIRALLRAWIERHYSPYPSAGKETMKRFLHRFDVGYRLRRLSFLERRLDRLFSLDSDAEDMFHRAGFAEWPELESERRAFRSGVTLLKRAVRDAHGVLDRSEEDLGRRPTAAAQPELTAAARATGFAAEDLRRILDRVTDDARRERARRMVERSGEGADRLMDELSSRRARAADEAFALLEPAFAAGGSGEGPAASLRAFARASYARFEDFDMVSFPLLYASETGETDPIEVIRLSPYDAPSLIDEPTRPGGGKVTGNRLNHFGAFLKPTWRANDIMWGRLDGAEILIDSLVPPMTEDPERRAAIVAELRAEAHRAILSDVLDAPVSFRPFGRGDLATLRHELGPEHGGPEALKAAFNATYEQPSGPGLTVPVVGRAAHIIGRVLAGIGRGDGTRPGWPVRTLSSVGRTSTGVVEMAAGRIGHVLWTHAWAILYGVEAAVCSLGLTVGPRWLGWVGATALALTSLPPLVARFLVWRWQRRSSTPVATPAPPT
jgi:patatin-related protein